MNTVDVLLTVLCAGWIIAGAGAVYGNLLVVATGALVIWHAIYGGIVLYLS